MTTGNSKRAYVIARAMTTEIWLAYKFGSFFIAEQNCELIYKMAHGRSQVANSPNRYMRSTVWVSFMIKPNGRLVLVSSTHCCASTSSLSKS